MALAVKRDKRRKHMNTFSYFLPVNLFFGRGESDRIGEITGRYGRHALLVTGRSSARKSGLTDRILKQLDAAGLAVTLFEEVTANPLTTTVFKGRDLAREAGCDVIIAAGGGSIMDCAKGIAFAMKNDGDIEDYIFGRRQGTGAVPLIAVPTTCGTGSEGNHFAVLTNPETNDKKSLISDSVTPAASIIDSSLMETMPQRVIAAVGFDALCHNMESYTSRRSQPLSDMMCEYAIRLIAGSFLKVYQGEGSAKDWDAMALASTLGGMAMHVAGLIAPHGMEHPLSGMKNITHGEGLAPLEPVVIARNAATCPEKYAFISRCFGGTDEKDCADRMTDLIRKLELPLRLRDLGFEEGDVAWLTENCMKVSAGNIGNNPAALTKADVEAIYKAAL